jgi:subtilisin family serine protease
VTHLLVRTTKGRSAVAAALALSVSAALLLAGLSGTARAAGPSAASKLRGDLPSLVSGSLAQDPRIAAITGIGTGRVAYFAVLDRPIDAGIRARLAPGGGDTQVLRRYRSVSAFALASTPAGIERVAALDFVAWLTPVEVVVALGGEPLADQTRGTPADVGAVPFWSQGITGAGVRIAVLDTGVDVNHQDLDDLDFGHWSDLVNPTKIIDSRNFNGNVCAAPGSGSADGHGHGSHVAGIATGTGEGTPTAADDGKYAGIAPDAQLAVAKVLTDAGAGVNSDLVAALEWAAMPVGTGSPTCPAIGADVINLSLGSEARSHRLNTGSDVDMVSFVANGLAAKYGALIVAAAGNSGPYTGSTLEAPGSAAQVLSVAASAKDYDLNHDDTASGDACSGYQHPDSTPATPPLYNGCVQGVGTQRRSTSSFSSRGPAGDLWLRPDVSAPGYNIVSVQSSTGSALAGNDLSPNTRADPLYTTATGTSMASPAAAGTAALLLNAYRAGHAGADPIGASGIPGFPARKYVLLRAALMNTAHANQLDSRWISNGFQETLGPLILKDYRNGPSDPFVGSFAEGAGKIDLGAAVDALRDGVVIYSSARPRLNPDKRGTGARDFQGSWQIGATDAPKVRTKRFVLHAALGVGPVTARFSLVAGHPSDGSLAIPTGAQPGAWTVSLPGATVVPVGSDVVVPFSASIPADAAAGDYTGRVRVKLSTGRTLYVPVFASIGLHDPNLGADNVPGPQARITSAHDVYATGTTVWPSVVGQANGSLSDWLVYPVRIEPALGTARFRIYDPAAIDTYDVYLYDKAYQYVASTHPFASDDTTDTTANDARGPSTQADPEALTLSDPTSGRYYLAVSRAKIGSGGGPFGSFVLTYDEVAATP